MGNLYNIIVSLCEENGVRPGTVCSAIGVSRGLITDLKNGRKNGMSAETAQKFAEYFGVTVGYLLGKEEKPTVTDGQKETPDQPELTGSEINLVKLFRQFPQVQQESIVLMVEKFHTVPADKRESALQTLQALLNMLQTP